MTGDQSGAVAAMLAAIVGAVRVGIVVVDEHQRVVQWNRWMEQHSRLASADVLGRHFAELFPELENGRLQHAVHSALRDNFASLVSQTLNRTPFPLFASGGARIEQAVHVMPVALPGLPRHCLVQIVDVSSAVARERQLHQQSLALQAQANTDALTGIANRRRFDLHLDTEFRRTKRSGAPMSLLMIDVDAFKPYNDHYGHQKGDACLARVAAALARVPCRANDLLARYGGEEFAVILPDTDAPGALAFGERLRREVMALELPHVVSSAASLVTISVGAATVVQGALKEAAQLMAAADRALYAAKAAGRNCVVAAPVDAA
jgi:diguanylate cyclase (GGDEF)-like protein/PAS domain S-box-containing protein